MSFEMKKITIIIKDLSGGKARAFSATIPELDGAVAMGDNFKELFEGIQLNLETAKNYKIGIYKKSAPHFSGKI